MQKKASKNTSKKIPFLLHWELNEIMPQIRNLWVYQYE